MGYGFVINIPGTPRGMQFTEGRRISASRVESFFTFSAAQDWNGGFSSGVALGSNWRRAGSASAVRSSRPIFPGNQTPERSGWPSAVRGAGPPGGKIWAWDLPNPATSTWPFPFDCDLLWALAAAQTAPMANKPTPTKT